jgi:CheY-like chemotaxis protein
MSQQQLTSKALTILLVEDNSAHAELILRCFENHRVANTIYHVFDGEAALNYLFRRGTYADPQRSPRPHVILLDLRLPRVDGLEVLQQIKQSPDLRTIPVVILTTSEAEQDVTRAYEQHANSYLVKPVDFTKLTQLIDKLGFYWLSWNYSPLNTSKKSPDEEM